MRTGITIDEWVADLVNSYYKKDCGLTTDEVTAIVNGSNFDKDLNYNIQCDVEDYIKECLWDLGKPTQKELERVTEIQNEFKKYKPTGKTRNPVSLFMEEKKVARDQHDRCYLYRILNGIKSGDFRDDRMYYL